MNKNLHLLPTDKPSKLLKSKKGLFLQKYIYENKVSVSFGLKNQNIYITNDEEIKKGDWVYYKTENRILVNNVSYYKLEDRFKIILTTDQDLIKDGVQAIPDEFLEWFVNNPSCEQISVEEVYFHGSGYYKASELSEQEKEKYSFMKEYKIIIPNIEIWKDIPEFKGYYQVSNLGNVKSLERYVKGKVDNRLQKENILSKRLVGDIGNQYYAVTLCNNKNRKQIKISVLVAMAFLNHIPNGYIGLTVDHIDNNPLNNNVNNLQVITKRENSSKDRKGISKYTGVTFNKKTNKWCSQIWINGQNKTLGSFDDELEAHRAYQKASQQHLKSQ